MCRVMVYSIVELMAVLVNLSSGRASWHVLCASRSGFEGGGVGVACLVAARVRTRGRHRREVVRGIIAGVAASRRRTLPQRRGR
jgi:hypothetical protein